MAREELQFRTALFGYRKSDVKNYVEHFYAMEEQRQHLAQESIDALEGQVSMVEQENSMLRQELAQRSADKALAEAAAQEAQAQLEAANRKLSAAQAEMRRYQTRLFALEREVLALRRENMEMEALCEKARERGITVEDEDIDLLPPLEVYPSDEPAPIRAVAERAGESLRIQQAPAKRRPEPQTELERISFDLIDQMQQLMETPAE